MALGRTLLREDAEFHSYQMYEAGLALERELRESRPAEANHVLIAVARYHGVLVRAPRGLPCPFPHVDDALGTEAHGCVNLVTAGALARAHNLPAERVAAILGDEEPAHFVFSEEGLSWQGLSLSVPEIAAGRRYGIASLGSCSFAEPLEGLRSSGVLG